MGEEKGFTASSVLLAFVVGGIVGAGLAILMAPQSGRELRQKIKEIAGEAKEKAEGYIGHVKEKVTSTMQEGKEFVEEKKSILSTAIEAGKEAYEREKEKHAK